MATDSKPVLITGSSGHVGANLVRRLSSDGIRVRPLTQRDGCHEALDGLDVELAYADIRDAVHEAYAFHYGRNAIWNPKARAPSPPPAETQPSVPAAAAVSP